MHRPGAEEVSGREDDTDREGRDVRDKFIDPRLTRSVGIGTVDLACGGASFRAMTGKCSIAMPVQCLDKTKRDATAPMK